MLWCFLRGVTMDLQLPPEFEERLRQQAAAAGMDVEQFAIAALQKEIGSGEAASTNVMLARGDWKAKFDALRSSFPTRRSEGRIDCSRETLYGDRGR
jgi:hypothetical protein